MASLPVPMLAYIGGPALVAILPLVGIVAICDSAFLLLATRSEDISRRALVFAPLVERLTEAAWLSALWVMGVPGWIVVCSGAACWMYSYTRARARQVGLSHLGMLTLGERAVRTTLAGVGFAAAAVVAIAGGPELATWLPGVVTVTATAWLLVSTLGLLQLVIVVHTALRVNNRNRNGVT
ncbi:hypothetical protein [Natronoglycomyces albus]|uniref:CDP-alcohol phosphatidyltransferase family protein n=1 Tax=Natronoglycomyces albus TaxID=2811108 RepID=A0A895XEZ1_9ACTN|nr:hypothetical protein [Natronoglycomyces albus]QSB03894.1 hypothetical protein JQS30_08635 [Natronoglycomyces albus]